MCSHIRKYMLSLICLLFYITHTVSWNISQIPVTLDGYKDAVDYMDQMETLQAGLDLQLTAEEQAADLYLNDLREEEIERTKHYRKPLIILDHLKDIKQSSVFSILQLMPKGATLHIHERHTLSIRSLLQIVWESPDFRHLYMQTPGGQEPWKLCFFINPPDTHQWINIKQKHVTFKEILKYHTMSGILSNDAKRKWNDSRQRWHEVRQLWTRYSDLISNIRIRFLYLQALFDEAIRDGIQYIEARTGGLGKLYELDLSSVYRANYGRRIIDPTGLYEVNATIEFIKKVTMTHSNFLGMKLIWSVYRNVSKSMFQENFKHASKLYKLYKNFVIGFDLVSHEDGGHSLNYFLPDIIHLQKSNYNIPFYFHAGESVEVYLNKDGPSPRTNLRDAILLGSKRIGHGLNLIHHPYLIQLVKQQDIAIEVNPVANQLFGYIGDFRLHPAVHFLHAGVGMVLSSDAPGAFGLDSYVLDWYVAFTEWSLGLKAMKKLIMNSWKYSGMDKTEKKRAVKMWNKLWHSYIAELHFRMCNLLIYKKLKLIWINNELYAHDIYKIAYAIRQMDDIKYCDKLLLSALISFTSKCCQPLLT